MTNLVAFTKQLLNDGYTQRQVEIITGRNQSWVQRIAAKKTYNDISMKDYEFDGHLEIKKNTMDVFLAAPEIPGEGRLVDQDLSYLKILKYCGVPYSKIRNIYFDRSQAELRSAWDYINQEDVEIFNGDYLKLRQDILLEMFGKIFY